MPWVVTDVSLLEDHRKDATKFREDLLAIARTTLSSKVLAADKNYFAELAVSAVLRLKVLPFFLSLAFL